MTELTLYIADDGTEFDCEEDCREYECGQRLGEMNIMFYNADGEVIPKDRLEHEWEHVFYVDIESHSDLEALLNMVWRNDIDLPSVDEIDDVGHWVYDEDNDRWFEIGQERERLDEMEKVFEKSPN